MYLLVFAGDYQILNKITQNLNDNIPRIKIEDFNKQLHKFASLTEIEKPNHSTQTSVLTDVSETHLDSSACIASSINVSVTSEGKSEI